MTGGIMFWTEGRTMQRSWGIHVLGVCKGEKGKQSGWSIVESGMVNKMHVGTACQWRPPISQPGELSQSQDRKLISDLRCTNGTVDGSILNWSIELEASGKKQSGLTAHLVGVQASGRPHHLNSVTHVHLSISLCAASAFPADGEVERARNKGEEDGRCLVSAHAHSLDSLARSWSGSRVSSSGLNLHVQHTRQLGLGWASLSEGLK